MRNVKTPTSDSPIRLAVVKSPSEPTIYSPALSKNLIPRAEQLKMKEQVDKNDSASIVEFLKNMRLVAENRESNEREKQQKDHTTDTSAEEEEVQPKKDGKEIAADLILQAEKHKASILPSRGKGNEQILAKVDPNNMNHLTDDGEFLHITCHVEKATRIKIQRGEFVELAKLLLKPKNLKKVENGDKQRIDLISRDGRAYLEEVDHSERITNVRKWEQAFRIYATIYSQANPERAAEIFQYINVINHAAKSYTWECVEYYDFMFRQMMESKPNRSWSKNFPELWTMAMTDPITKYHNQGKGGVSKPKDWRDFCCWRFNKGHCKHGPRCRYDHKCTYCGSRSHPVTKCPRKAGNGEGHGSSRGSSSHGHGHSKRKRQRSSERESEGGASTSNN